MGVPPRSCSSLREFFSQANRRPNIMIAARGKEASPGRDFMESTRRRVHRACRSVSMILAIIFAVNGCASAIKGVEEADLARLRDQEVVAVHYPAPSFFVRKTAPKGGQVVVAPLILLPFAMATAAAQNSAQEAEERAAGTELANEVGLEDPVGGLKERLASRLAGGAGIRDIRSVAAAMDSDDLKSLKQAFGSSKTVLDLKTTGWGLHYHVADPKTFVTLYRVRARLIRLDQEKVLWNAEVGCFFAGDRRFGTPTLDDLRADGGALLKTTMAKAAENCVAPLLARFHGEAVAQHAASQNEAHKVTVEPATLAQAEAALFGPAGLVEGSQRFEAKFQGLTLTAKDLPRLRTMMKDAAASPWRSEVQFRGTIDGVAFKAEMDKGSSGRAEYTFEGLQFDDEEQASAFLTPLRGRGVREVKLVGAAGGQSTKIILATSASTGLSPSPPDDVGSARGPVDESPRKPANDTPAGPAPASAVSQPTGAPNTPIATAASATPSVESQLERLDDLRARGVITEDEHATLRKRALESGRLTPPGPTASLTARPPSRPSVAPGALNWPSVGSSWVLSERTSGSYGSGRRQVTVTYDGEKIWEGKKVRAFSGDTLTTYVDDRRRILARVRSGTVVELFEPYFAFAHW
ncbi:MAG TPA: hypothetical protein VFR64_07585, partial [Methylomirabilota bacterium]|nr:hypothetical protein [Methylomirabilota bacterium]